MQIFVFCPRKILQIHLAGYFWVLLVVFLFIIHKHFTSFIECSHIVCFGSENVPFVILQVGFTCLIDLLVFFFVCTHFVSEPYFSLLLLFCILVGKLHDQTMDFSSLCGYFVNSRCMDFQSGFYYFHISIM